MSDSWFHTQQVEARPRNDGRSPVSGGLWHSILSPDYSAFTGYYRERSDIRAYGRVMSSLSAAMNGMPHGKR